MLLSRGARVVRERLLAGLRAVLRGLEEVARDCAAGVSGMSSARTNLPPPPGPPGTYFLFFRGGSSWSCEALARGRTVTRPERELRGVSGREDIVTRPEG